MAIAGLVELILRDYQDESVDLLRKNFIQGCISQLLYAPTGAGKTEIALSMLKLASEKGVKCGMIMDRRILCSQTSERLDKYGIPHGVRMAGHGYFNRKHENIQICSAQTLEKGGMLEDLGLLVIDEAHCTRASTIDFIRKNPKMKVVGLSASPFTQGLGSIYTKVVSNVTTKQLVETGKLSPLRVFIAKEIDMEGAAKVAGEWSAKDASERGIKITGDIVSEWVKKTHEIFGKPEKTIVFSAGVAHGMDLSNKFAEAGYNFVSISYKDDNDFKDDVFEEFKRENSSIHGIIATDILTKGFDQADVMIGISARPFTKSFSSHVQQLGRVMRPHAKKEAAIWLDHSGNYLRFQEEWDNLFEKGVEELKDDYEAKAKKEKTELQKEAAKCPKCGGLWTSGTDTCTNCGFVHARRCEIITKVMEEMVEIDGKGTNEKYSSEDKERWYQELLAYAEKRKFKDGWAFWKYKEKFGVEPAWKKVAAESCGKEVQGWITSRNIAFAHSKKK